MGKDIVWKGKHMRCPGDWVNQQLLRTGSVTTSSSASPWKKMKKTAQDSFGGTLPLSAGGDHLLQRTPSLLKLVTPSSERVRRRAERKEGVVTSLVAIAILSWPFTEPISVGKGQERGVIFNMTVPVSPTYEGLVQMSGDHLGRSLSPSEARAE